MHWTQEADLLLFKYLLQIHKISPDYKKLAEAMGNGVTAKAVTHRIARVRGMSAAPGGAGGTRGDDGENMSSPDKIVSTPTKAKREKNAAAKPTTPTKGRKGGNKKRVCEDDEDEGSPKSAKKVKVGN